MMVGDLVRHTHNRWGFGIVIEVIDDHWETRLPSAFNFAPIAILDKSFSIKVP